MDDRFFISHVFFLTAFLGLVLAAAVVLFRLRKNYKALVLAFAPIVLIFVTAYLGKHLPWAHQVVNVFYDALLLYNAYFFWRAAQWAVFWLYAFVVVSTVLDFAMHFVIGAAGSA